MNNVLQVLKKIQQTSSRNDKEQILRNHKDNELLKQVLLYTFDPYRIFGIGKKSFRKVKLQDNQQVFSDIINLLDYLLDNWIGYTKLDRKNKGL